MKKKILMGLLASALVCLAFVFTNASNDSFNVSGTAKVYYQGMDMRSAVQIDVSSQDSHNSYSTRTELDGSFIISLHRNDEVTFSYSDGSGSVSETRSYTSGRDDESIRLNYIPGSHHQQ